jgi:hypothetical protein
MKMRTVLLSAALLAAVVSCSIAQVASVNTVGYAMVSIPPGKQALLNNPLNGGFTNRNRVRDIIPFPNNAGFAGSAIFRYDSFGTPIPGFRDPIEWFDDFGWYSASDEDPVLYPGEGFFLRNAHSSAPAVLTFTGDVPEGHLINLVPGNNRLALRGSQTPRALPLGDTTINSTNTLNFPADDGDAIFFWNVAANRWDDPYEYFEPYGWFAATGDQGPAGPVIHVGIGFGVRKGVGKANKDWVQDYNVN